MPLPWLQYMLLEWPIVWRQMNTKFHWMPLSRNRVTMVRELQRSQKHFHVDIKCELFHNATFGGAQIANYMFDWTVDSAWWFQIAKWKVDCHLSNSQNWIQLEQCNHHHTLTHRGRDKIATISQTAFWNPEFRINNIPAFVQIMAWRRPGDKPLSEPMMVSLLTYICITRPQWVK